MDIMESSSVPPGFRFRPTEEELVGYYLKRKVNSQKIDLDVIIDIDLYRIEPWDIQDRCKLGNEVEEQNEWYFFSHKDRKYPTGTRTNRATTAGFWKATGRDKAVFSSKLDNHQDKLIGMRKTLVFYQGRAPNGRKSDFIMHEYRLQSSQHEPTQEEGWVVCRAFKKPSPSHKQAGFEGWNNHPNYYARSSSISDSTNHYRLLPSSSFPTTSNISEIIRNNKDNLDDLLNQAGTSSCSLINPLPPLSFPLESLINSGLGQMVELPNLDSPSISTSAFTTNDNKKFDQSGIVTNDDQYSTKEDDVKINFGNYLYSEWKSFDKLLASPAEITGASSYAYINTHDEVHELDAHTHISHVLDQCFPDL